MNINDYNIEKSVKKVRMSEQHMNSLHDNDLIEDNFESFKKDVSFNDVLKFKIFDTILGKNLHFNICLEKQRIWLGYLGKYLKNFISFDKEKLIHTLEDQLMIKIHKSLQEYITMKENFEKSSFNLNPKYFKASSKIDKSKLEKEIQKNGGGGFSCGKYAGENGHSKSTVTRYVKKVLSYVYVRKRLQDRRAYYNSTENCIASFLIYLTKMIENKYELIFMDESSFDNHKRAKKRWINKRKMHMFHESPSLKSVGNISCISKDYLIHYIIRRRKNTAETISFFLKGLVKEINNFKDLKIKYNQNKICLLLDNAKIHKTDEVIDFLNNTKFNVCFLPPYTPNANPVERLFLKLKSSFYQRRFSTV